MSATSVNNAKPASPASQHKRGSAASGAASCASDASDLLQALVFSKILKPGQVEPVRRTAKVKSVSIEDFLDGQTTGSEMVRVAGK